MNLWAKRAGLLFSAAVLIFLISCEDDSYLLGFKGKTKFKGRYQELVFDGEKSSVLLLDSVFTDQDFSADREDLAPYRFLIGGYSDPDFGNVNAHIYARYLPSVPTYFNKDKETVEFKSATVQLLLDFYAYGPEVTIDEVVNVYDLENSDPTPIDFFHRYVNSTVLPHSATPIAQLTIKKYDVDTDTFTPFELTDSKFREQSDRSPSARDKIMLHGELDEEFAFRIFNWIASRGDTALVSDTLLTQFRAEFPGLAFESTKNSRLIGINPVSGFSCLTLYHKTPSKDTVKTVLYFTPFPYVGANGFTNITTLRSGGASGISVPQERYFPSGPYENERYIQEGGGLITELDLGQFYNFIDTMENIIINSAEISMDVKSFPIGMPPPPSLYSLIMKEEGGKIVALDSTVQEDFDKMSEFVGNVYTDLSNFAIASELSAASPVKLTFNETKMQYTGYATLFFQRLFENKDKPELNIEHIGFYPATSPILKILYASTPNTGYPLLKSGTGNSVNRAVINASGIKLKLYYTVPNKPNLE